MWIACANRNMDCILALINAGADHGLANAKGSTPLMQACQKNHCAAVGALLAAGARVARREAQENSPVLVCCRLGRPEILGMLLTHMVRCGGEAAVRGELAQVAAIDGFGPLRATPSRLVPGVFTGSGYLTLTVVVIKSRMCCTIQDPLHSRPF